MVWANRAREKHASGRALLVKNIQSKLLLRIEGAVWVELQVGKGNNVICWYGES